MNICGWIKCHIFEDHDFPGAKDHKTNWTPDGKYLWIEPDVYCKRCGKSFNNCVNSHGPR